jgi:hypothetical protein
MGSPTYCSPTGPGLLEQDVMGSPGPAIVTWARLGVVSKRRSAAPNIGRPFALAVLALPTVDNRT